MNRTKQIYGDTRKELVGVVAQEDWADQLSKIYRAYEEPVQGELGL